MNSPLLRTIYVIGTGLIGIVPQVPANGVLIGTRRLALLPQSSAQRISPYPQEFQEWQRQVKTLHQQKRYQEAAQVQGKEFYSTENQNTNRLVRLHNCKGEVKQACGPLSDHSNTCPLPEEAEALERNARIQSEFGRYAEAARILEMRLTWYTKKCGPEHVTTAYIIEKLADQYSLQGLFAKAESYLLHAIAIRKQQGSNEKLAYSLSFLGGFYRSQGRFGEAEPLLIRAQGIIEKDDSLSVEEKSYRLSSILSALADLYLQQGLDTKVNPLIERIVRNLEVMELNSGKDNPNLAETQEWLADYYLKQQDYDRASALYMRALRSNPFSGNSMRGLVGVFLAQNNVVEAEKGLIEILEFTEQHLAVSDCYGYPNLHCTPDYAHPDALSALVNLAIFYVEQGAEIKASPLFFRAMEVTSKMHGPTHPSIATSLAAFARAYQSKGNTSKAEALYIRALKLLEKSTTADALGVDSEELAMVSYLLSSLYISQRAFEKAQPLLRRSITIESRNLQRRLPLLPQSYRRQLIQGFGSYWELSFNGADHSPSASDLALFSRLNRYGLMLEIEQKQALLSRTPGAPRQLADQINALTSQLADVQTPLATRLELLARRESLERELYGLLPPLQPKVIDPSDVAKRLPQGSVLLEFQRYSPLAATRQYWQWGSPHYLVLVLNPSGSTRSVDLGPADSIDRLITQALVVSQRSGGDPTDLWRQVNSKVFPPALLQLLAGTNQWILDPDGELSRIPFAALPSPIDPQRRLTDSVVLRLISSGRGLLPQSIASTSAPTRPLVLANPDFGPAPSNNSGWPPLPDTAKEGDTIGSLLQVKPYERAAATTAVLTRAKSPALVHIASHGYYAKAAETPPVASARPSAAADLRSAIAGLPASRDDAMLNSFIVLAGANRSLRPDLSPAAPSAGSNKSADDGYLTAKEAAQLQLEGTQMVVLSACDSASGDQQSGEGLFGLQRALSVAGARTTLLSLWKVDDEATAYFMQRYYTLLKQGKGRMEALLAVQKEFRDKPLRTEWVDYRYWAAWQLMGDSGPIPRIGH